MMRKISMEELTDLLVKRDQGLKVELNDCLLDGLDLSGMDLHGISFDRTDFRNVKLDGADIRGAEMHCSRVYWKSLRRVWRRNSCLVRQRSCHCLSWINDFLNKVLK